MLDSAYDPNIPEGRPLTDGRDSVPTKSPLSDPPAGISASLLDCIPTQSRPPIPTKTPFTHKSTDHKVNRPPLRDEPATKGDNNLRPGYSFPPADAEFPSSTEAGCPSNLPTAIVVVDLTYTLRPSPFPDEIGDQTSQSEEGLLVFLIILLLGGLFSGCLFLMQGPRSFLRRIGRRYGWKWVKKFDSVDLKNTIFHLKVHPGAFEEHHLVLLREVLAGYEESSYVRADEKAAEEGRLDSTDCSPLTYPRPARMAL
ncbi:hypothetical protein FPCIR_11512 [Fusarium pseudocircinatum]|uniref:Uncharacterized protein n=1 Tax=Fusarium pseudocircinatum TaxID=56676 RepID=A0A8H5NUF0_9HYPO|nr:hypothetical protein FPCIR_11512 [Fusarium pseudocircinatum]